MKPEYAGPAPLAIIGVVRDVKQFSLQKAAPPMMFVLCLFGRGGVLDGWRGIYYALQRTAAELILSLSLVERRLLGPAAGRSPSD